MNKNRLLLSLAVLGLLAAGTADPAHSGSRELEVLFADMTPEAASSEASRACVKQLRKVIAKDFTTVARKSRGKLLKGVDKSVREQPFFDWPDSHVSRLHSGDTVVLVDCRPEKKTLDVLVNPPSGGVVRMRVRHIDIGPSVTGWVGKAILRRAWIGFSP